MTRKSILLSSKQSAGDILMLTAAVRDLHLCHPDKFRTAVDTLFPELWENNPFISGPAEASDFELIECEYPLIECSKNRPVHFLHGYMEFIGEYLGCRIVPMEFKGDVHLSEAETSTASPVTEAYGYDGPYWLICAGGKHDFTIKWWDIERFQSVVDALHNRVQFVQIGAVNDFHLPLKGVLDMRGRTTIRQLIRLVYRASGAVCPVTFLMHLCAAVPLPASGFQSRPCVVVAGGRESPHWEAYPTHQFIHTIGALDCCREGGCWRSRTLPLGDGDAKDLLKHRCVDVVNHLPRCMDMITAEAVIRRIEYYL